MPPHYLEFYYLHRTFELLFITLTIIISIQMGQFMYVIVILIVIILSKIEQMNVKYYSTYGFYLFKLCL